MAVVAELIREENGTLSFGNYGLRQKGKVENFAFGGDVYKVKTFHEITKLERNGLFAYESVPGTTVTNYRTTAEGVDFVVEGLVTAQIIVMLEEDADYEVYLQDKQVDLLRTNIGGKLALNVELSKGTPVSVHIVKK